MAKIAILGTRESGKTVLMTVLAKRYQNRVGDEPFLKAMDPRTMAFTEKNWHRLTVERDWPPLTPPGELMQLHWELEHAGQSHEMRLFDFAGETFRQVFGKHKLTDPSVRNHLASDPLCGPLLAELDRADVLVLLINLRDFINRNNAPDGLEHLLENQWALRGALDYFAPRLKNRIALVFTQIDQYPGLVNGRHGWQDVLREHLPTTQIADIYQNIECMGVAVVPDTELVVGADGQPFLRPAVNFSSWFLESLMEFTVKTCAVVRADEEDREAQRIAAQLLADERTEQQAKDCKAKALQSLGWAGGTLVVGLLLLANWNDWGVLLIIGAIAMAILGAIQFGNRPVVRQRNVPPPVPKH